MTQQLSRMTSQQHALRGDRPVAARMPRRRHWLLEIAIVASVAVHLGAVVALVALKRQPARDNQTETQGTIELLMVEQKGAEASQAGQPQPATHAPQPQVKPEPKPAATQAAAAQPAASPPPVVAHPGDEKVPEASVERTTTAQPPTPDKPETPSTAQQSKAAATPPAPQTQADTAPPSPPAQQGPVFSLDGTDSDTNAVVLSDRVIPAAIDDKFRNRPPPYPDDAAMRGEQGDVVVVIHVAPDGLAAGADVEESSGSASLDQAAVMAVKKWHFHPAMKDGQPIAFDIAIRFAFRPL